MSALGMRAFRKPGNNFDPDKPHVLSEATARRVDEEIEKIIQDSYAAAGRLLDRNRTTVKAMAEALLDQESLEADDLREILARTSSTA
jgi:ATP-dependent Zn protease